MARQAYLEYRDPDQMVWARWWGGEYIELGYADADPEPGEPGEWHAHNVINVWDYAEGAARIPFTGDALVTAVDEYIAEEDRSERGVELCDECEEEVPESDDDGSQHDETCSHYVDPDDVEDDEDAA